MRLMASDAEGGGRAHRTVVCRQTGLRSTYTHASRCVVHTTHIHSIWMEKYKKIPNIVQSLSGMLGVPNIEKSPRRGGGGRSRGGGGGREGGRIAFLEELRRAHLFFFTPTHPPRASKIKKSQTNARHKYCATSRELNADFPKIVMYTALYVNIQEK